MSLLHPPGYRPPHFPLTLQAPSTLCTSSRTTWLTRAPNPAEATPQGKRTSGSLSNTTLFTQVEGVVQAFRSSQKNVGRVGSRDFSPSPYRRVTIRLGHGVFSLSPADVFVIPRSSRTINSFVCVCSPRRLRSTRGGSTANYGNSDKEENLPSMLSQIAKIPAWRVVVVHLFVRRTFRRNLLRASSALTLDGDRLNILGSFSH